MEKSSQLIGNFSTKQLKNYAIESMMLSGDNFFMYRKRSLLELIACIWRRDIETGLWIDFTLLLLALAATSTSSALINPEI